VSEATPFGGITLPFERILCPRHGEPFRAEWPRGYPLFAVKAIQRALEDPALQTRVNAPDRTQSPENSAIFSRNVEAALDEKPACCRMKLEQLLELYRETGLGVVAECSICGEPGEGTRYQAAILSEENRIDEWHACFRCVVYAERPWARPA